MISNLEPAPNGPESTLSGRALPETALADGRPALHEISLGSSPELGASEAEPESEEWLRAKGAYREYLEALGKGGYVSELSFSPIRAGGVIVGTLAAHSSGWSSFFLLPEARRRGLGERVVRLLIDRGDELGILDPSEAKDLFIVRGYRIEEKGEVVVLTPPSRRADLKHAASICLLNPNERKILLGQRLIGSWLNFFAFPGGKIDPGEEPLAAAVRELHEETKISVSGEPIRSSVNWVGNPETNGAYRVTNFIYLVDRCPEPTPTSELRGEWVDLDSASDQTKYPMGLGTKAVLRQVREICEGMGK